MRRKERIIIFLGTIICIVILSFIPTISAVESHSQQQNMTLQPEKIITKGVHNLFPQEVLNRIRHPILYSIVKWHIGFRADRGDFLMRISTSYDGMYISHPILHLRGDWLFSTADSMCDFWNAVSVIWNWPYLSVYDWSS